MRHRQRKSLCPVWTEGAITHLTDASREEDGPLNPQPPLKTVFDSVAFAMAIYHFSLKHGSKAKGRSGGAHAKYILREQQYDYRTHELVFHESKNMPDWATTPVDFWQAADTFERANARIYSEFEIAIPRELNRAQQIRLIQEFAATEIGNRHPYTLAIHEPLAQDRQPNPHAHVMFTARSLADGIKRPREVFFKQANSKQPEAGGAKKDRSWMKPERLLALRASWEQQCNCALKQADQTCQVDHRSLEARGIDRPPEPKLTPYDSMLWKQGIITDRTQDVIIVREIAAAYRRIESEQQMLSRIRQLDMLMTFEHKEEGRLGQRIKALESALSERVRLERELTRLNQRLEDAPRSKEEAGEVAKERLFGQMLLSSEESIHELKFARDELAEALEAAGLGLLTHFPRAIAEGKHLIEIQVALNAARANHQRLIQQVEQPAARLKISTLAEKIYAGKVRDELERNRLLEDVLPMGESIRHYEGLIGNAQELILTARQEQQQLLERLTPAQRAWISPTKQIAIGQEQEAQDRELSQRTQREHKLQMALKLVLKHRD